MSTFRLPMITRFMMIGLLLIAVCRVMPAQADPATGALPGGTSPEECFSQMKAAFAAQDWRQVLALGNPAQRDVEILGTVMACGFMTLSSDSARTALEALTKKHGIVDISKDPKARNLAPNQAAARALAKVKDRGACYADLMTLLSSMPNAATQNPLANPEVQLADLKIEGNNASANLTLDPPAPIKFVKVEGRWYLTR